MKIKILMIICQILMKQLKFLFSFLLFAILNFDETIKIKPPHREPVKSKQFSFLEEDLPIE